ncbi:MAG: DUF192 domain-containing protein [Candidatus Paceibacterota bacterium]
MKGLGKFLSFIAGVMIVLIAASIPYFNKITEIERKSQIKINEQIIIAEVVSKEADIRKGLSGRESIGINEGMLFLFDEASIKTFWMKDMNFPIDIVWIRDNKVVGIEENVKPESRVEDNELSLYVSPEEVDRVLELMAGRTRILRAGVGDEVSIRPLIPSL